MPGVLAELRPWDQIKLVCGMQGLQRLPTGVVFSSAHIFTAAIGLQFSSSPS
jgi:hypothetical protein